MKANIKQGKLQDHGDGIYSYWLCDRDDPNSRVTAFYHRDEEGLISLSHVAAPWILQEETSIKGKTRVTARILPGYDNVRHEMLCQIEELHLLLQYNSCNIEHIKEFWNGTFERCE